MKFLVRGINSRLYENRMLLEQYLVHDCSIWVVFKSPRSLSFTFAWFLILDRVIWYLNRWLSVLFFDAFESDNRATLGDLLVLVDGWAILKNLRCWLRCSEHLSVRACELCVRATQVRHLKRTVMQVFILCQRAKFGFLSIEDVCS
jgi:hypothetical protein